MKNPTSKKVGYLINKLKSVENLASKEGALNMNVAQVSGGKDNYKCGTVHCHAGWYAVANKRHKVIKKEIERGYCGYTDGVELMCTDLEFNHYNKDEEISLVAWAIENPKIWGNNSGKDMFRLEKAFNYPGFCGIIRHWQDVRDRLLKIESEA